MCGLGPVASTSTASFSLSGCRSGEDIAHTYHPPQTSRSATQRWLGVRKIQAVLTEVNLAIQRQALRGVLKVELGGGAGGSGVPSKAERLKQAQKENQELQRELGALRIKLAKSQDAERAAKRALEEEVARNRNEMKTWVFTRVYNTIVVTACFMRVLTFSHSRTAPPPTNVSTHNYTTTPQSRRTNAR